MSNTSSSSSATKPTSCGSQSAQPRPSANDPGQFAETNPTKRYAEAEDGKERSAHSVRDAEGTKRPVIPQLPRFWDMYYKRPEVYTPEEKADAWSKAGGMVQGHSDEMIKRWKEEIDTYLVFAGLFSAVLTTFNVQTYVLLQPDSPGPDATVAVLQQISSQLSSFSIAPPFVNSTQPSSSSIFDRADTPPSVPLWAIWLNAFWFSGLILSLAAASIGIMVKQWLNEYSSGLTGTSRSVIRVRQYRLDNLRTWRVQDVVGTIPVLLQLALALFLAGLLILLWSLHHTVAAVASCLVGLLAGFTVATTLLPLFNPRCSFLTPQIRALNYVWQPKRLMYWTCARISAGCHTAANVLSRLSSSPALHADPPLSEWIIHSVGSLMRLLETSICPPDAWKARKQTWRGRERASIDALADDLDKQTLLDAYSSTLHPDALSAATVCLMDFEKDFALDYFRKLHTSAREHFGPAADSACGPLGQGNQQQMLWLQVFLGILMGGNPPLSDEETTALGTYFKYGSWPSSMKEPHAEWALKTINSMLHDERTRRLDFLDDDTLSSEREHLLHEVLRLAKPFRTVVMHDVLMNYRDVRLSQSHLAEASSEEDAMAAHTTYLKSVRKFLSCANTALTLSIPSSDLENVRVHTRDVLVELTRDLLRVLAQDRVRTTIASTHLDDVIGDFNRYLADSTVDACITDDLVLDMLRLLDLLSMASDYVDARWVGSIQTWARQFKDTIIRVKGHPSNQMPSPEPSLRLTAPIAADLAPPCERSSDNMSGAFDNARHPCDPPRTALEGNVAQERCPAGAAPDLLT